MKNFSKFNSIFLVLSVMLLVSCGGGGSSVNGTITSKTNDTQVATPVIALTSNVEFVVVGMPYSLNWTSQNTTDCSASGSWSGSKSLTGNLTLTPSSTGYLTHTLTCGSATKSLMIEVLPEFTSIPDTRFEEVLINLNIDNKLDGKVKTENILNVRDLWIVSTPDDLMSSNFFANLQNGYWFGDFKMLPVTNFFSDLRTPFANVGKILDMTGIENFRNLEVLNIAQQNFSTIDLRKLTKLKFLSLNQIPLNAIDVNSLSELRMLGITETPLTTISISNLTNLFVLEIQNYEPMTLPYTTVNGVKVVGMTSIDISNQKKLIRFYCMLNRLTNINLSENNQLQEFWASKNLFERLDFTGMSNLTYIILTGSSQLNDLNIKGVSGGGVPYRLYTENSPKLREIKVTSVQAIKDKIAQIIASTPVGQTPALGLYWDSWTTLVNAP